MPRAQNAHAIMNGGFLFKLDANNKVEEVNVVYGCINANFINATRTASALKGDDLFTNDTLQKALNMLNEELRPNRNSPEPSPFCRKILALGLFYKVILSFDLQKFIQSALKNLPEL